MKFEEAIKKLSEINEKLDLEDISLDESVKLFKEGIELSEFCRKKLDDAKLVIENAKSNSEED